jgi:hypothetical protein
MTRSGDHSCTTPRDGDLGLGRVANATGLAVSTLPNGSLFAIEHQHEQGRIMLNQVLGSPIGGGIGRLYLRTGGPEPRIIRIGPGAPGRFGAAGDRFVWDGESSGLQHRVTLWLHPKSNVWLWHLALANRGTGELPCDAILVQDLGLGGRGFLMNNEAYVSQYIDHHIAADPRLGPVVMSRQNQAQSGKHPWVALGCLDGAAAFSTDALQLFGPAYRDADSIGYVPGANLPSRRVQHEVACPALQSRAVTLKPGASATRTFFGLYEPDHADASADADLARIDAVQNARRDFAPTEVALAEPVRSILQDAPPVVADPLGDDEIARRYPERRHEERCRSSRPTAATTAMSCCATRSGRCRDATADDARPGHGHALPARGERHPHLRYGAPGEHLLRHHHSAAERLGDRHRLPAVRRHRACRSGRGSDLRRGAPGTFQRVEEIEAARSLVGRYRTAPQKKARHHTSTGASKDSADFGEIVPHDRHSIVLEYGLDQRRVEGVVVVGES